MTTLCVLATSVSLAMAPPPAQLGIDHDTTVIPPRAQEALDCDPLGVFAGVPAEQRMNVGLRVQLSLSAPGGASVTDIQWTIPGQVIKGYHIASAVDFGQGFLADCTTEDLSPSDLQSNEVAFYYTEPGVSEVVLSAVVDGVPMMATRTFDVRRNPKAEIFYVTGPGTDVSDDINGDGVVDFDDFLLYQQTYGHDADPAGTIGFGIIGEHAFWHNVVSQTMDDEFFRFHRGFIQKADCWRGIFGYPCVRVYATAPDYVPAGDEVDHLGTGSSTEPGCDAAGDGNGVICRERDDGSHFLIYELPERFTIAGDGAMSLADFPNAHEIVVSIIGYHNDHHGLICNSGDFTFPETTPADPIFWRFHLMLTKVHELWQFLKLHDGTLTIPPVECTSPAGAQVFYADPDLTVPTSCLNPIVQDCNPPSGSVLPLGRTTVTCTVRDVMMLDETFPDDPRFNQGTTMDISFDVLVVDTTPPDIDCPVDATVECGASTEPDSTGMAEATDICDPDLLIEFDDVVIASTCPADPVDFVIERTWTATDESGNSDDCLQVITVLKVVLPLDIKPGSCPNSYNRNSHGVLPVGLLGSDDLDVSTIDISTILISRADCIGDAVAPIMGPPGPHPVLADVGTPFKGDPCDCHELEGDGIIDWSLKFSTPELVEALELDMLPAGSMVELVVSGQLDDGCGFIATDCVRLVRP